MPTAITLADEVPHTLARDAVVASVSALQAVPLYRRTVAVPLMIEPTTNTSAADVPQTPRRKDWGTAPLCALHLDPSKCSIVAGRPTANTSVGELPQTPDSSAVVPLT